VLVVGGGGTSAELYDPATGAWTTTGSLHTARYDPSATLLTGGQVLVAGGSGPLASAELYNPATGAWTTTGSTSRTGNYTTALLPSGQVLTIGGGTLDNGAERYAP
jgi:hypothetical protein